MKQLKWKKWIGIVLILPTLYFILMNIFVPKETIESGKWTRVDDSTIMLEGTIENGNFDQFKTVFDDKVKTVIINSGGGDTYEAVQIGLVLKDADVDVIVRGYCLSSAANYLFTAGKTKTIEDGIVGFHGNSTALANIEGGVEKVIPWYSRLFTNQDEHIERIKQTIIWEKEFFHGLGISQELFEITQRADMGYADGKDYDFLLPSAKTFARYGINNVIGDHSKKWINIFYEDAKKRGMPNAKLLVEASK